MDTEETSLSINTEITTESTTENTNKISRDILPTTLAEIKSVLKIWIDGIDMLKKSNTDKKLIPTRHKSIESKMTIFSPKDRTDSEGYIGLPLKEIILEAFEYHSPETLRRTIRNYFTYLKTKHEDIYWYNPPKLWKSLGVFIYSGIHGTSGFLKFDNLKELHKDKNRSTDPIIKLRDEFEPVTRKFDRANLFNKVSNKYFGFNVENLTSPERQVSNYRAVRLAIKCKDFSHNELYWTEEYIVAMFYNRKRGFNEKRFTEMLRIRDENIDKRR